MESNQRVFDEEASVFTDMAMFPAERVVLQRLAPRITEVEMLDLGVGTGRTGWTYAPLVRRYVGIDYSPRMIQTARRRFAGEINVELEVADARDLSGIEGEFDFILFSFNAIDAVDPGGRAQILDQVRSKLRPDGLFQFSTHSLGALPFDTRRPLSPRFAGMLAYRLYAVATSVGYARRIRAINRRLDLEAARERGWTVTRSMAHNFRIHDYYVDPEHQLVQLREHGLEAIAIYDPEGREVTLPRSGRDPWFDYLCAPVTD